MEDFLRTQQKLRDELKAELEDAHADDRSRLQGRIGELEARIAEPEKALEDARKRIADLESLLTREGNEIRVERLDQARDALRSGDYSIADDIFAEIEAREQLAVQRAARAAYGRGEVAEAEVRWADAADHFARAAELNDDFGNLKKAHEFAWRAGRLPQALSLGEKLMAVTEGEPERRATALNGHAMTLQATGRFNEAEPLYREAMEIGRETLGERHPDYAARLNNLAALLQATGRYDAAEPLYREALEIDRDMLGERHPDYATRLNNLAALLASTGGYDEAEPLYREALAILEAALGPDHPTTKTVRNNLDRFLASRT